MKWWAYFLDVHKQQALSCTVTPIAVEYGEVIYQSAAFPNYRWLVTDYKGEFNVFMEQLDKYGKSERKLAATFQHKDRAVGFAMKMFLVCCGRIRRVNRGHV
jgi:hypothetical protein